MCSQLKYLPHVKRSFRQCNRLLSWHSFQMQTAKPLDFSPLNDSETATTSSTSVDDTSISSRKDQNHNIISDMFPTSRVVPMVLSNKEPVVLSFDSVPGPKSLKYLSGFRHFMSLIGTQLTAGVLTTILNLGTYVTDRKSIKNLSTLFDEYGPVVRFVSPVGGDIVLINHPDHIQKVYAMEGEIPIRSALDSLEKYRTEHRSHSYGGLFTIQGEEWIRQRELLYAPINSSVEQHVHTVYEMCDKFTQKVYNLRNYQDELSKDLYKELHKWTFDCIGLLMFSKKFSMLDTDLIYSQCDTSWMYHSLVKATDAIIKCESGLHMWKLFTTPAWFSLVKHCDSLDALIGKHVLEVEQEITKVQNENNVKGSNSLIRAMLLSEQKMSIEDIVTVLMDILLIGVNTISTTMSFLMYNIAKYQKSQKTLYQEVGNIYPEMNIDDINKIKANTPYLQACIKETLRLVPPIPLLTRILPRNITLDRYNIPRGTLIMMSTQDSALKESNFEDATRFVPERWLTPDSQDFHPFASLPFGHGARRCLGQGIAETMLSLLTIRVLQKYKLEYHYGDIQPTRSFIARPNKPLKIRFIDRI